MQPLTMSKELLTSLSRLPNLQYLKFDDFIVREAGQHLLARHRGYQKVASLVIPVCMHLRTLRIGPSARIEVESGHAHRCGKYWRVSGLDRDEKGL